MGSRAPVQLALPLPGKRSFGRHDFIVAPGNAQAVAFVDAWPHWPVAAVAMFGPAGSGKTHLAAVWQHAANAIVIPAAALAGANFPRAPIVIEDVDTAPATDERDHILFQLLETATPQSPVMLTGRTAPPQWTTVLPDLASRLSALVALPLWKPDDALLGALARKLLADRQLIVAPAVVGRILACIERSPGAVREFIAMADAKALAEGRPVNLGLVRELLAAMEVTAS